MASLKYSTLISPPSLVQQVGKYEEKQPEDDGWLQARHERASEDGGIFTGEKTC
jgi:hypothetical protein